MFRSGILFFLVLNTLSLGINTPPRVAVFCGATDSIPGSLKQAGYHLGELLKSHGFGLMTGGGGMGLMRQVVDGYISILPENDYLIGVTLPRYAEKEGAYCARFKEENLIWVSSLYERIEYFRLHADAFVVLPGGFGTMHEALDCLVHNKQAEKPIIFINIDGWWDFLFAQFKQITDVHPHTKSNLKGFVVVSSVDEGVEELKKKFLS